MEHISSILHDSTKDNRGLKLWHPLMPRADAHPRESWLNIIAEARKETNPKKLILLIETLCKALEHIRVHRKREYLHHNSTAA